MLPLLVLLLALLTICCKQSSAVPVNDYQATLIERCGADPCSGIPFSNSAYLCGDPRLGPKHLPTQLPEALEVNEQDYDRLGGLCPAEFLEAWWDDSANAWKEPPELADYSLNITLIPGMEIDLFGSENGTMLWPADTPYAMRSLPPQDIDIDLGLRLEYHLYQVTMTIQVNGGFNVAFYDQIGGGRVYDFVLSSAFELKALGKLVEVLW